jgi:acyl-coenzyme A thioesterase PaaI-like protein
MIASLSHLTQQLISLFGGDGIVPIAHVFRLRNRNPHRARWGAIGLKLKFYTDDEGRCIARFRPKPEHQGYPGQLHGGIISSLLDEPT